MELPGSCAILAPGVSFTLPRGPSPRPCAARIRRGLFFWSAGGIADVVRVQVQQRASVTAALTGTQASDLTALLAGPSAGIVGKSLRGVTIEHLLLTMIEELKHWTIKVFPMFPASASSDIPE
ncbi:MAG: hypothetical protein LC772_07595 [Chloroflexi bacterium]|nr:hypothetical protein [Chloroflexota bacterium]